jgi:membrane protein DedA with SNARE-associated domain
MNRILEFLVQHGYAVLFAWVFAEQIGLPIPAVPILLASGALAGAGRLKLAPVVGLSIAAALTSDLLWYEMGRRRGAGVLRFLCRVSLEPDSCVRRTESLFQRHGARGLLVAKFVPGLNTAAPPLAGIFHMSRARFLIFDTFATALWIGVFVGSGYVFSEQLELVAAEAARLGRGLLVALLGSLAGYVGWKYVNRRRFLRELRIARIAPEELKRMLDAGENVFVVDLRQSIDFEADPEMIPGSLRMAAENLEQMNERIPRDRDVVLYCT